MAGHIANKTFPKEHEILKKGGSISKLFKKGISKIIGKESYAPYLSMGGEDFSYYLEKIPGCFYFVGSAPIDKEPLSIPHHCSHFHIDENALLIGSSTFVKIIEDLLINC